MKSNLKKFIELFPLKVKVSQSIINEANIGDTKKCIGALSLQKALGEKGLLLLEKGIAGWGSDTGYQRIKGTTIDKMLSSFNEKNVSIDMMDVKNPFEVTFKLSNE
jgi:hypothetical protein